MKILMDNGDPIRLRKWKMFMVIYLYNYIL